MTASTKTYRAAWATGFTGDDPLGFDAGDANLRRVVGNDPTDATDPSGLEAVMPADILGFAEGNPVKLKGAKFEFRGKVGEVSAGVIQSGDGDGHVVANGIQMSFTVNGGASLEGVHWVQFVSVTFWNRGDKQKVAYDAPLPAAGQGLFFADQVFVDSLSPKFAYYDAPDHNYAGAEPTRKTP